MNFTRKEAIMKGEKMEPMSREEVLIMADGYGKLGNKIFSSDELNLGVLAARGKVDGSLSWSEINVYVDALDLEGWPETVIGTVEFLGFPGTDVSISLNAVQLKPGSIMGGSTNIPIINGTPYPFYIDLTGLNDTGLNYDIETTGLVEMFNGIVDRTASRFYIINGNDPSVTFRFIRNVS